LQFPSWVYSVTDIASSSEHDPQKRRSTRLVQAIPLMVIGMDALGQPFKERTSTMLISCHGCKYQSKHYVPVDSLLTLEIPRPEPDQPPRSVRGRVIWVQRPPTIRELFQIGVEFDEPGNIWGIAFPPKDWFPAPEEGSAIPSPASPPAGSVEEKTAPAQGSAPPTPVLVSEERIHALPSPSGQMPMAMARQMARLLAESKQHLQRMMQEGAAAAVAEQVRAIREQVDAQIRDSMQATVESTISKSVEQSVERAVERALAARTQTEPTITPGEPGPNAEDVATQLEAAAQSRLAEWQRELEDIAAPLRRQFQSAVSQTTTEAQKNLEAWHAALEDGRQRAVASLGVTEQAIARAEESTAQLSAAADSRFEEARRRMETLVAAECAELERRTDNLIEDRARRLEPALEETAQQILTRAQSEFGEQLERQLAPHLERAQHAAATLASAEQQAEEVFGRARGRLEEELERRLAAHLERAHQTDISLEAAKQQAEEAVGKLRERIREAADHALGEAFDRIRQQIADYPAEFEQGCRAALGKLEEEIEAKTTEATHTTFEALYKSAEWYQKKAHTSMQSSLEKVLEQATGKLRDHAAEISRVFAAELDHYSRNYAEHTKGLMEEAAKEIADRGRNQLSETTETSLASFADELHRIAGGTLDQFEQANRQSAEQVHAAFQTQCTSSLGESNKRLSNDIDVAAAKARQDLQTKLLPMLEKFRAQFEGQQRASLEELGRNSNDAVEQYKSRLENASNSWLLASATTLGQHSQAVLETMAQEAEKRLRDICSQVFAGMGEVLRQRMAGLAGEMQSPPNPPEKK
jgi:hypothetical protein